MLTRTISFGRESWVPSYQKLLSQLKKVQITSPTWHLERLKALKWLNPEILVALHNTIIENSIHKNSMTDRSWIQAIWATLRMLWIEIVVDKKYTVGLPTSNTYSLWPSWDMIPSISWEEIFSIKLRNPEATKKKKQKSYEIQVGNTEKIHELLKAGEWMEEILWILSQNASNAAITRIAHTNSMIWIHRRDFVARTNQIIEERKQKKE